MKPFVIDEDCFRAVCGCKENYSEKWKQALVSDAEKILSGQLRYYAHHWKTVGVPPDWFLNPFNGARRADAKAHWTRLPDFDPALGDIKNIWETSRFEWVVTLARAYMVSGEKKYLEVLNDWLHDWMERNPLNLGPHWKCGQEAAIRVINLLHVAYVLKQWDCPCPAFVEAIYWHLDRIYRNRRYAIAQDNNHGTSEAAALFIGGNWLMRVEESASRTKQHRLFAKCGRKLLENRLRRLVEEDGSFSQHSVNYHRLALDTLSFVEFWRQRLQVKPFSALYSKRVEAMLCWMLKMTDMKSGGAPNLGANDGALLLASHGCDFRDFRPSIQLASALFRRSVVFPHGIWDEPLYWLGFEATAMERIAPEKVSEVLPGGYVILVGRSSWGVLRFPMFRFRPSHNDVFHFDLWARGVNILRDTGSYSYNSGSGDDEWFRSVQAHNTVSFDGLNQMPRLGRFMLGRWIKPDTIGSNAPAPGGGVQWMGSYRDHRGNRHRRTVTCRNDVWTVEDILSGPYETAEIRYHMAPDSYKIYGNKIVGSSFELVVESNGGQIEIQKNAESLYYWEKNEMDTVYIKVDDKFRRIFASIAIDSV